MVEQFGQAGLAGLGLAVVVLLYRQALKLPVFSRLSRTNTFRILNTLVIAVAGIAALAIIAGTAVQLMSGQREEGSDFEPANDLIVESVRIHSQDEPCCGRWRISALSDAPNEYDPDSYWDEYHAAVEAGNIDAPVPEDEWLREGVPAECPHFSEVADHQSEIGYPGFGFEALVARAWAGRRTNPNAPADLLQYPGNDLGVRAYGLDWLLRTDLSPDHLTVAGYPHSLERSARCGEFVWYLINHFGPQDPRLDIRVRNRSEQGATIEGFSATPLESIPWGAGSGGYSVEFVDGNLAVPFMRASEGVVRLDNPYFLDGGQVARFDLALRSHSYNVGDGGGVVSYAVFMQYHDGERVRDHFIGTFIRDVYVGPDFEWVVLFTP